MYFLRFLFCPFDSPLATWPMSKQFQKPFYKFKVCKSVHHHTIQINHQLDSTICPVYYPDVYLQLNMFLAFPRPSSGAHDCSSSLWFYLRIVVTVVLFSWSGRPARTGKQLPPRSNGKPRGCHCSRWAPDDRREDARNMLSCKKTSSNKLEKFLHLVGWFIWIVQIFIVHLTFMGPCIAIIW